MKKRIFSLGLLSLVLVGVMLCVTSCNEVGKINSAVKNTGSLTSVSADVYTEITNRIGEKNATQKQLVESLLIDGERACVTSGKRGEQGTTVYTDGAYAYIVTEGGHEKVEINTYNEKNGSVDRHFKGILCAPPIASYNDVAIDNHQGELKVTLNLTAEQLTSTYADLVSAMNRDLEIVADEETVITYADCVVNISVRDGYVTQMGIRYNITVEKKGSLITTGVSMLAVINSAGGAQQVVIPN